jgi:hypothetical protein
MIKDPEIDDEPEDGGIAIDFEEEVQKAELSLGEMLRKMTNATDSVGEVWYKIGESDSDSSSGSSSTSLPDGDD